MDNFRRKSAKKAQSASVDGLLSGGSPSRKGGSISFGTTDGANARPRIDTFRRSEGFASSNRDGLGFQRQAIGRKPRRDQKGKIQVNLDDQPTPKRFRLRPRLRNKRIAKIGICALVVVLLGSGYFMGKSYLAARKIFKGGGNAAALEKDVDPAKLNGEGDGRVNILLLGKGGPGHEAPDLTDTIVIASIDPVQNQAALLSIPRDLYISSDDYGEMKINAVYATAKTQVIDEGGSEDAAEAAGFKAIEAVVTDSVGLPIHYHVMVDFTGFEKAIDAVGGIDINVTTEVYEVMYIKGRRYVLDVQPGMQHFDGFRALAYSRSRYTSQRGDFDRAERQRQVLIALKEKTLSVGTFANPVTVSRLIDSLGDSIETNISIDKGEVSRLYELGQRISSDNVQSVGLADPPNNFVTTANVGGLSVVIPRAGMFNFTEVKNYVRNVIKDGFLISENASINVLNGTNISGLANRTATDLKSYGYNIATVGDSPIKNQTNTTVVDLRGGAKKYTKRYLEQRFGVTAVTSLPDSAIDPGTADFVIILGTNEETRLEN